MNGSQQLSSGSAAGAPTAAPLGTTPTHYAVVALLWLILPAVGAPLAILTGAVALLFRNGKTRLSNGMAAVAIVLGICEAVYLWVV